jgi:CRISPR/Cas system-associated exonuclease Cas4 (RecB family)
MDSDRRVTLFPSAGVLEELLKLFKGYPPEELSRIRVIFPGERPRFYLLDRLARTIPRPIFPPQILSFDRFLREVYFLKIEPERREATPAEELSLLYEFFEGEGIPLPPARVFFPRAREILALYEEIMMALIGDPSYLAGGGWRDLEVWRGENGDPVNLGMVLPLVLRFYAFLRERGFITRALIYRGVLESFDSLKSLEEDPLIFAGFFREELLTRVEGELFRRFSRLPQAIFFDLALPEILKPSGDPPRTFSGDPTSCRIPEIEIIKGSDPHLLSLAVREILQGLPEGERTSPETAILLFHPSLLLPLLEVGLTDLPSRAYNISLPYPAGATPLGRFLGRIADLVGGIQREGDRILLPREPLLHLLSDPYARRFLGKGDKEDLSFLLDGGSYPTGFLENTKGSSPLDPLDPILKPFLSVKTVGEFVRGLLSVLESLLESFKEREIQEPQFSPVYELVRRRSSEILLTPLKDLEVEGGDLPALYRQLFSDLTLHFSGTPLEGLQILGVLEARTLRFKNLILFGVSEENFPGELHSPFLPESVRRELGLPTLEKRREKEARDLYYSLLGAERVYLLYEEPLKGGELSRYLQYFLWKVGRKGNDGRVVAFPYTTRMDDEPGEIEKTPEIRAILEGFTFTPTSLDTFLECPLRFYYHYLLGVPDDGEISTALETGDLLHRIFYEAFREVQKGKEGQPIRSEDLSRVDIESIVERILKSWFEKNRIPQTLSSTIFWDRVKGFFREYWRSVEEKIFQEEEKNGGIVILELEGEFEGMILDGVKVEGRVDRVERRREGIWILDYKFKELKDVQKDSRKIKNLSKHASSEGSPKLNLEEISEPPRLPNDPEEIPRILEEIRRIVPSTQPILYGLLLRSLYPTSSIFFAYRPLRIPFPPKREEMECSIELWKQEDSSPPLAKGERIVRYLVQLIKDDDLPFTPPSDLFEVCPSCPYQTICGTTWTRKITRGN